MTDTEVLERVLGLFEVEPGDWVTVRRNGLLLLALPGGRRAAVMALRLYQPQRPMAKVMMVVLRAMAWLGLHRWLLPRARHHGRIVPLKPDFNRADEHTSGVLMGSPEHRVRRAIASLRHDGNWEVAKIAFGPEGAGMLVREAAVLDELHGRVPGVPHLLGLHRGEDSTVLRMPYLEGAPIRAGETRDALRLLNDWVGDKPAMPATGFPEWPDIVTALSGLEGGQEVVQRLAGQMLRPVVRHGDFARWNLRRGTGMVVLDWEWGHAEGMPGLDLAHYFLQDARLVRRLPPQDAIEAALEAMNRPECRAYLERTGWTGAGILPIIASLAFKQGARHQDNAEVLACACARR